MASQPERVVLTYQDLLQLLNDRNRYELFEGELQVTAARNIAHQTASINLSSLLHNYVRANRLGRVLTAPCDVHFSETTVVEPDLLFVSAERAAVSRSGDCARRSLGLERAVRDLGQRD